MGVACPFCGSFTKLKVTSDSELIRLSVHPRKINGRPAMDGFQRVQTGVSLSIDPNVISDRHLI